jgi:fumarate hydratase subunit beta/L(+)-tartrate dehydratase beta subunit
MGAKKLTIPLSEEAVRDLKTGDVVYLSGHIFTARDMAHLRLRELSDRGEKLPKDFCGAVIFHAGPVALKDKNGAWRLNVIGPTTSIRMEPYADYLGALGVRAIIGKGGMAGGTGLAASRYGYVYLQAAPGCAARLAEGIKEIHDVTWYEMGMPEAIWDLTACEFGPLIVGMDTRGNSIYDRIRKNAVKTLDALYPAE